MSNEVDGHLAQPKLLVHLLHGHAPQVHALMCFGVALIIILYKSAAMKDCWKPVSLFLSKYMLAAMVPKGHDQDVNLVVTTQSWQNAANKSGTACQNLPIFLAQVPGTAVCNAVSR